jgi:TolA-binding protein
MTVVGLHPEELFDKLGKGELSPDEAARLRQHLAGCNVCRFEYTARLDFQAEALEAASGPPAVLPLRPLSIGVAETEPSPPRPASRRPARRRLLMVGMAAAALISASAALAASVAGRAPWGALGTWLSERPAPRAVAKAPGATKPPPPPVATVSTVGTPLREPPPALSELAPSPSEPSKAPRAVARAGRAPEPQRTREQDQPEASATDSAPEAKANETSSPAKLFGDANRARRAGDLGRAIALYHLLQDRFPGSPEAELSRVTLALLLLDSGDPQGALMGFDRYLAGASRGLEAEALVGRARALGRLGRRDLEVSAWEEVQRKYPRSVYGRQATERLTALGQP